MPRTKKNGAQQIADILAKFNIQTEQPIEIPEADYGHNNALAMFAKVPEHFVQGKCMECGLLFAHNQPIPAGTRVGYCSDSCRKAAFKKNTGLDWGMVNSSREPWDGDPPMIITPEQYKNLEKIADWFMRNRTTLEIHDQIPTGPEYLEDSESPTSQESAPQHSLDFDDELVSEQESQYQEVLPSSPLVSPDSVEPQSNSEVDDVFDF
jgi:hypothetical protein